MSAHVWKGVVLVSCVALMIVALNIGGMPGLAIGLIVAVICFGAAAS